MSDRALPVHEGLIGAGRLPPLVRTWDRVSVLELTALAAGGCLAALATVLVDFDLRIPGHAILRSVLPMALGMALVPRRFAGAVMGSSALATLTVLRAAGQTGGGPGAVTSLCLTGPFLDLALWRARVGWRLYLGCALAGLGSNLGALAVRAATRFWLPGSGGRALGDWWSRAFWTYAACGILAGLLSAVLSFHLRKRQRGERPGSERT